MNKQEIAEIIIKIYSVHSGIRASKLNLKTEIFCLYLEPTDDIQALLTIEKGFDIDIEDNDYGNAVTIGDVVNIILNELR